MKREHNISEQNKELIFYAPLTYGDLTDHVSNVLPFTKDQNSCCGTATWDDVQNAYRFAKYNGRGQCVRWANLALPVHVDNTNHITDDLWLEFDINYQSTDTSNFIIQRAVNLGGYENTNHNTNCLISNCTVGISRNVWHHIIVIIQNRTVSLYCDGELISVISDSLLCYRNYGTLDVNLCKTSVSIGKCDASSQNNDLYMKDIKLYRIV